MMMSMTGISSPPVSISSLHRAYPYKPTFTLSSIDARLQVPMSAVDRMQAQVLMQSLKCCKADVLAQRPYMLPHLHAQEVEEVRHRIPADEDCWGLMRVFPYWTILLQ